MWAKQRRDRVLLNVDDGSAAHQTVMRWNAGDTCVWSAEPAHEAIVGREDFDAVQARMVVRSAGRGTRKAPKQNRTYALRHRLRCGVCNRVMQGTTTGGRTYFRCKFASEYANAIQDCDRKLNRYRDALDAGTDPAVVAGWIKGVSAQRVAAEAQLAAAKHSIAQVVTTDDVKAELEAVGGLLHLLNICDPSLRAQFYAEVGLEATFDPAEKCVEVRVLNGRVGGGT